MEASGGFSNSPVVPPPRSLLDIRLTENGFIATCDCATTTEVVIGDLDHITETAEFPFTCDGCNSTHWFTARPAGEAGG